MQAIRDHEGRVRYFGYDVAAYQIFVFALSAAISGLAGMLYTVVMEFASPTFLGVQLSLSVVVWCAVGGRQSLVGAFLGAVLVAGMQGALSEVRRVPGNLDVGDGRAVRAGRAVFAEGTRRSRAGRVALDRGAPSAFARGDAERRRGQGGQRMTTHLDLRDISVSFNGFKALNGLNMSVRKGELRCLIGPNGAGKTTALDIICGKVKPSVGTVTFDGTALHDLEEHEIARVGVGRKFQVPSVFRDLTVAENLEVARARRPAVWANLRWDVRRAGRADIERLAELIGLTEQLERPAAYLSHGQTQWLEIGMLVAQDAELILMDEPTAGMTGGDAQDRRAARQRLKGKHTLVVVEHDMGFVQAIGDIITVMHLGQLLAEGTVAEIESDPEVRRGLSRIGRHHAMLEPDRSSTAFYGHSRALQDINLEVDTGEFLRCSAATASARQRSCADIIGLMDRVRGG